MGVSAKEALDRAGLVVGKFCRRRVPRRMRKRIRLEYEVRGGAITIVERRPPLEQDLASEWSSQRVAQLRYDERSGKWTLFWPDSSGRWHPYEDSPSSPDIASLIEEVDADPTGIFWG